MEEKLNKDHNLHKSFKWHIFMYKFGSHFSKLSCKMQFKQQKCNFPHLGQLGINYNV